MSIYPYTPLDLPHDTRILTVKPGNKDDGIVCSLSHMRIDVDEGDKVKYDALSYCWSKCTDREPPTPTTSVNFCIASTDHEPAKNFYQNFQQFLTMPGCQPLYYHLGGAAPAGTILCDGVDIPVGGELLAALKRLRAYHGDDEFKIWIDAVCINQNDISERNEHIKIMNKIYRGADWVRVWLGEEFGSEGKALESLDQIASIFDDVLDNQGLRNYRFAAQRALVQHEDYKKIDWGALATILTRSWFRRVWVIQELANAEDASVHIGRFYLHWNKFSFIVQQLLAFGLDTAVNEATIEIQNLSTMCWIRKPIQENSRMTRFQLLPVLGETRSFRSTNAVDKIYGILSLFPESWTDVQVDYSTSVEEVYTKFAVQQLKIRETLEILYHCTPLTEPRSLNLPSWVPDWSQPSYTEPYTLRMMTSNAAGETKPRYKVDETQKTLRIYGKLVDTIIQVEKSRIIPSRMKYRKSKRLTADIPTRAERRNDYDAQLESKQKEWHGNVVQMVSRNLTRPIPEDLWRVFMCNRTRENAELYERCKMGFEMHMTSIFMGQNLTERLKWHQDIGDISKDDENDKALSEFQGAFHKWCYNRRFFETERGAYGWAMHGVQEGDEVWVLYGSDFPFVIRPVEGKKHRIVSDCYLHGFMDGEALTEDYEEQELVVI